MQDLKFYREGTPFTGRIGRTAATSEPAWPLPPRARDGAPNVLVFLLDDVGFAQLGCYGSDIRTPTFDRLAANGLRYRDFHTTAICSPTRACLLTGRNHHSNGVGIIQEMATGYPGYNGMVPRENGFLSEMLLAQGYATLGIGKWHLTLASEYASGASKARWPLSRGFERFYGFIGGKTNQWVPTLVHDSHYIDPPRRPEEGYHLNADLADHAIEYLTDLRTVAPSKPFFMYYCLGRGPRAASRRARMERALPRHVRQGLGSLARGSVRATARDGHRAAGHEALRRGRRGSRRGTRCPTTRAGSTRGRWRCSPASWSRPITTSAASLDFLERLGELDNTIVLLASDNGASAEGGEHGSFNENQFVNRVEPSVEENLKHLDEWGSVRSFPNYSWGWAWAGNTPLRRWKRYLHQGGMSDPLIVHWPKGIAARGEVRGQYVHVVDFAPTILEALGLEAPAVLNGVAQRPIEGVSFAHTFNDAAAPTRKKVQYYEMIASRALWADGWKAVVEQPQGDPLTDEMLAAQKWELYHVAQDFSECEDLAGAASGEARRARRAMVGRGAASTTCCRSTRACSCAWASASRAPCPPATGACSIRAARRSSSTRR